MPNAHQYDYVAHSITRPAPRMLLVAVLVASAWLIRPAEAAPVPRPVAQAILPAECLTKTSIRPLVIPSWVFVINFEGIPPGPLVGCLLIFRAPGAPSDTILVPCIPVGVGVSFMSGVANLSGGHIRCPININAAFASLSPPALLSQSSDYPFFTIVGVGRITPTPPFTETFGNPIAYYTPSDVASPGLGMFVPISNTLGRAVITSRFNGVTNMGSVPFQPVAGGGMQSWSAKHSGLLTVYTVTHSVGDAVLQNFTPREPVSFWTDGGVFWIGGSPLGPSFRGALDEVVIDPPDGGVPPAFFAIVMQ